MRAKTQSKIAADRLIDNLVQDTEGTWREPLDLRVEMPYLMILVCQVQLALRHPQNKGPAADWSKDFVNQIRGVFLERGMHGYVRAIDEGTKEYECSDSGKAQTG